MPKKKTTTRPKLTWRDYPDSSHTNRLNCWPSPESLHPTETTIINAICGDKSAQAILMSYATSIRSVPMEVLA
jgi:hypothetical protein